MKKTILAASTVIFSGLGGPLAADEINWAPYMGSAHTASAIAAAITLVGACSVPITADARVEGTTHILSFTCSGTDEQEATVALFLDDLGGVLVPVRFEFAG